MENRALVKLIEMARKRQRSPAEAEAHRRSFAYGNLAFENGRVTAALIERIATTRESKPPR